MQALSRSEAVRTNYYALMVSILTTCIPETAFEKLQSDNPGKVQNQLTDDDWVDIAKLKSEGLFFREIGAIYCMDPATVHRKLKSLSKRGA